MGLHQVKTEVRDGLVCMIRRKGEDKVIASVDNEKYPCPTWQAAEEWIDHILQMKRTPTRS